MKAIKEMHRQVGDLVVNERGIAERGVIVRHLVMPNGLAGHGKSCNFWPKRFLQIPMLILWINIVPVVLPIHILRLIGLSAVKNSRLPYK